MLPQAAKESDDKQPISGIIQPDDVYWVASAVVANGSGRGRQDAVCGSSGPEQGSDIQSRCG